MNPTEIKAALEGILKATSKTTFSPRDKALLRSLLHTMEFSILACPNRQESSCPPTEVTWHCTTSIRTSKPPLGSPFRQMDGQLDSLQTLAEIFHHLTSAELGGNKDRPIYQEFRASRLQLKFAQDLITCIQVFNLIGERAL